MSRLKRLVSEVHRRSLWQVLLIYMGGAWVAFEIVQTLTARLLLPRPSRRRQDPPMPKPRKPTEGTLRDAIDS